ncbi:helix-turn-helix transcriptional regulator [Streptomyces profundus]|uniref:helix-turn-helix transcriptional regulator n=1 Tax=Streptomyces profundus TaxID=2867410 RepID=UPI001D168E92|nr:LuxR family transcriptional regulator [Streptomyces sp. MA3_2.13]UED87189.1 AAA family ATPase [Streptomyces sp. MA3_2.13]
MALVERDHELRTLNELFAETNRGRGRIALVSGAVASGKSELLHALIDECAERGAQVLTATATRGESDAPFGVLRQLLDQLELPAELAAGLAEPSLSQETLQMVATEVARHGRAAPLLACVDDVHHADEPSLAALSQLVKRFRSVPMLLVLTESSSHWSVHPALRIELVRQTNFRRVRLAPLSLEGVAEVLGRHLAQPAAWNLAQRTHSATGGNQLLVRAVVEDYIDASEPAEPDGPPTLGESFRQAVLTCLHRGAPETLQVAQALAVLDTTASADRVAALLDRPAHMVTRALQALASVGLVEAGHFRHPQARAAVYDAFTTEQLTELHTRAARLLHDAAGDATEIADHLVAARHVEEDWAVTELRRAAEKALAEDDEAAASRYTEFALSARTDPQQRATLRFLLVQAEWRVNPEGAARHLPLLYQAQREGGLDPAQTAVLLRAALWYGHLTEARELVAWLTRPQDSGGGGVEPFTSTVAWLRHDYPQFLQPVADSAARIAAMPLPEPGQIGSTPPGQQAQATTMLSALLSNGRDEDGRWTRVAEQILQTTTLSDAALEAIMAALQTLIVTEQLATAARWCDTLLEEARERDVAWWQAALSSCRAEICVRNGELADAEHHALRALKLVGVRGWGVAVGAPISVLLEVAAAMGDFESARKYLREPVPEALFETRYGLPYLRARGRYYLATGQLQAALENFRYCGDLMLAWELDAPAFVPWRSDLAEVYLRLGEHERAQQLAKEQIDRSGSSTSRVYGYSLRVLAATANRRARLGMLKESVEVLQARRDRLPLAQALTDLSRVHHSLGDFGKARMISRRARRLTKECQAQRPTPKEEAVRSGQLLMVVPEDTETWTPEPPPHPRPRPAESAEGPVLTLSERRVATLASLGYTNREISGKLHITVSTVEQHMTKVFRKLRVKRRTDLPVDLELREERSAL